ELNCARHFILQAGGTDQHVSDASFGSGVALIYIKDQMGRFVSPAATIPLIDTKKHEVRDGRKRLLQTVMDPRSDCRSVRGLGGFRVAQWRNRLGCPRRRGDALWDLEPIDQLQKQHRQL